MGSVLLSRCVVWVGHVPRLGRGGLWARGGCGGVSAAACLSIIPRRVKGRDKRALRALDTAGSRPACRKAAERLVHTMTRHTTIRRADVAGLLPRGAYTAGVPLTAEQCSVIISLLLAEIVNRADGCGLLPVTNTAVTDDALHNIARIMDRAITDISVLRNTPQRAKR